MAATAWSSGPKTAKAEIELSQRRGWRLGNAEYTQDPGGLAMPFSTADRNFPLLLVRIDSRLEEFARTLRQRQKLVAYITSQE